MKLEIKNLVHNIIYGNWEDNEDNKKIYKGKIAEEIIDTLLNIRDEDNQLDFKKNLQSNDKLGKLCSCFSNNKGGAIVFGIVENKKTKEKKKRGIKNDAPSSFAQKLGDIYKNICKPDPKFQILQLLTNNEKTNFVIISFSKAIKEPVAYKGIYFKRLGEGTVPQPYEEVALYYPGSFIEKISRNFQIYSMSDNNRINNLNHLIKMNFNNSNLKNFINFCEFDIENLLNNNSIIFTGKKQSGKTTYSLEILKKFQQLYSKKSVLLLIPKNFISFEDFEIIRHDLNIIIFCDRIDELVIKQDGNKFAILLKNLQNSCIRNSKKFHMVINFDSEEYKKILNCETFTSYFITDKNIKTICNIDSKEIIRDILSTNKNGFKKILDNDFLLDLFTLKIKNNPTIGYVLKSMDYLNHLHKDSNSEISAKTIQNIDSNLDQKVWFNKYLKLLPDKQVILGSIRLLYEYKIEMKPEIIKIISSNYYEKPDISFNKYFKELELEDWFKIKNNIFSVWPDQISSIPLEYKGIGIIEKFKSVFDFITLNLENDLKEISQIWLNKLGELFLVYGRTLIDIEFAKDCFNRSLKISNNPRAFFGLGNCYDKKFKLSNQKTYLTKAIEFLLKSESLDSNNTTLHNNLGAFFHSLALFEPIGNRKDYLDKALKHLEKSIDLKPNFATAYVNIAWNIYHRTYERTQIEFNIQRKELYALNEEMIKYIAKGQELLPYMININEQESINSESLILFLKGKVHLTNGRLQENNDQLEIALDCFQNALKLNPYFPQCLQQIINVKYAKSIFNKSLSKRLLQESKQIIQRLVNEYNYNEVGLELDLLKINHGLIKNKKIKDAIDDFIQIEKKLSKLYKKIPKYQSKNHVIQFWIHILHEIFINFPPKMRIKHFKKYVKLNIKYLSLNPDFDTLNNFNEGLNDFLKRKGNLTKYFINHSIKKINKFNELENIQDKIDVIIKTLEKIRFFRSSLF